MIRGSQTQESLANSKITQPQSQNNKSYSTNIKLINPTYNSLLTRSKTKPKMNFHEQISSLEKSIKTLMFSEDPNKKEFLWPMVQELAILNNTLAVKLIQKQKFEKAETFLLKAKQITEPLSNRFSRNWSKSKEWLLIRLALYQNLALIYKNQKQYQKAYDLLSDLAKAFKIEVLVDRKEIIMTGGYETLYINLALFCKKLQKLDESLFYAEKTIEFLQSLLRNNGLIKQISEEMKQEKQSFDSFLTKKNTLLASLIYMKGKILAKQGKEEQALDFLNNAYLLTNEYLGQNNEKTLKFKGKYESLRNKLNFLQEMCKNTEMNDFQAFKQEIDGSQQTADNPKNNISSITELDEHENGYVLTPNIEQPLQIQRGARKKETANFFMCTNLLRSKETEDKKKKQAPIKAFKKESIETDMKFNEILKNSRIIYPRNRSPQNFQISFEGLKQQKSKNKTRSSSKSKTPSPNQKNLSQFSLVSGFTSSAIKSTLNSSAFYNKLSVNSSKTKALYQATINRFFKKPKEIMTKPQENPLKFVKDFPKLASGEPSVILQQTRLQLILNKRPSMPVNCPRPLTPGIQVTPVSRKSSNEVLNKSIDKIIEINNNDTLIALDNNDDGNDKKFIKRRPTKSISSVKPSQKKTESTLLSKKKTSNYKPQSMKVVGGKIIRVPNPDSLNQLHKELTANLNSPGIKTLASIAESLGKNESAIISKNNSSVDSESQISINYQSKDRKNSTLTGKISISEALEASQSFNTLGLKGVSIPRLSREIAIPRDHSLRNQFTPKQKNQKETHQTFQNIKLNGKSNKLKTMKSLDININNNPNNISKCTGNNTPISPKKGLSTKKSISFVNEPSFIQKEMKLVQQASLEFAKFQAEFSENESFVQEELEEIQSPEKNINLNEAKYEKAVKFIQKTFRKTMERKLLYVQSLLSNKKYCNDNNTKLADDIQDRLSKMRMIEVLGLLKNAKLLNDYMTFQEIMALDRFPLRFYSSSLNGFGLKSVFWKLDECVLHEEFKLVMSDPNDVRINDEWRYHESFSLVLRLQNSINREMVLHISTKERLGILKNQTNYIWKAANMILDQWFVRKGFDSFFKHFTEEKGQSDLENKQIVCFYRIHDKAMKETDREELCGFKNRLIFLIEKMAYLVRKPVGFTWIFQEFFKETPNYTVVNKERYHLLRERSIIRRYFACHLNNNLGLFLTHFGIQKEINNADPTGDIKLFYDNFEPFLKENTFDVLFNQHPNKKKWKIYQKARS